MHTRYIHLANTFGPFEQTEMEVVKELKRNFPPMISRRMTKLALMIGECIKGESMEVTDAVIYATTFSETACLEKYLDSFPTPSPLMFQNSIHPSGMEQVLIARKQAVEEFMSFGGDDHILHSAIVATFTSDQPTQWLIGAEEKGTWLTEKECASAFDFAYAVKLSKEAEGALAKLVWTPAQNVEDASQATTTTLDFLNILKTRKDCSMEAQSLGQLELNWVS